MQNLSVHLREQQQLLSDSESELTYSLAKESKFGNNRKQFRKEIAIGCKRNGRDNLRFDVLCWPCTQILSFKILQFVRTRSVFRNHFAW